MEWAVTVWTEVPSDCHGATVLFTTDKECSDGGPLGSHLASRCTEEYGVPTCGTPASGRGVV